MASGLKRPAVGSLLKKVVTSGSVNATVGLYRIRSHLPVPLLPPSTEWYWKVLLRHWVYRVCAAILFLFSFIIVWSEATFGIPNVRLSIIANIIYLGHNNTNYIVIEVRFTPCSMQPVNPLTFSLVHLF